MDEIYYGENVVLNMNSVRTGYFFNKAYLKCICKVQEKKQRLMGPYVITRKNICQPTLDLWP